MPLIACLISHGTRSREIELSTEHLPMTFGRSPQTDVRVDDRWTSRRHCELSEVDGSLWVSDLDSTHGTFVNGRPVREAVLAEGDILQVGLTTFRVSYQGAAVAAAQLS